MHKTDNDDPASYPALGRALTWVDKPGSANKIFWALAIFCGLLFIADFTYEKHGKFMVENIPGFFGVYGFVMFSLLILSVKVLRYFIKRPEDFYGDKTIDSEAYPEDQLERLDHDA
jgi:hypothetical protein